MRLFTPRKHSSVRTAARATRRDAVLHDILTGPDTPHRRELEILIEERGR